MLVIQRGATDQAKHCEFFGSRAEMSIVDLLLTN